MKKDESTTLADDSAVLIHTDGSCLGNPGPGGYGAVLSHNGRDKELSGGYRLTTNNRMEIMAVIKALEALKRPCRVEVVTDSRYVRDAIEKSWLTRWKKNGWRTSDKKAVRNQDLWEHLDRLLSTHQVVFSWVRGHAGHAQNERCDQLASSAAQGHNLAEDVGYAAQA